MSVMCLQFQQNEVRQLMQNPEAVRAMMQIQQGMMHLQQAGGGNMFGMG